MRAVIALGIALFFISGCGSSGNGNQLPDNELPVGLQTNRSIDILGEQRSYHLYLPDNPTSARMVFLLHGNRGSSDQVIGLDGTKAPHKFWLDIALRENLVLVVPDGAVGSEGHQG